jgi:hypothetical protein
MKAMAEPVGRVENMRKAQRHPIEDVRATGKMETNPDGKT